MLLQRVFSVANIENSFLMQLVELIRGRHLGCVSVEGGQGQRAFQPGNVSVQPSAA